MSLETSLWSHQVEAINRAKTRKNFALFFEMGTGKTRTQLEILRNIYNENKRVLRTIVFCPLIVTKNWGDEIAKYTKIQREKVVLLGGTGSQRVNQFEKSAFDIKSESDTGMLQNKIFVMNYEALLNDELFEAIKEWQPEVLVLDESHRCARMSADRTKRMVKLTRLMDERENKYKAPNYRFILTGTPILKDQMDLFGQFLILDGGESFGTNFFAFRAKYFFDRNANMPRQKYFPNWVPRKDMEPVLTKTLADKSMTAKKADCLDLPEFVREKVFCELAPDQNKAYQEMKKHMLTYLNSEAVVATLALTKMLRLQQILSGFYVTDEGETKQFKKVPRLDALTEVLEALVDNHKVIVWTVFKETYKMIGDRLKLLGIDFVEIHGEVPNKEKFESVEKFNSDPRIRVLVGNPGSGGIGINLTSADFSVWYSRDFSLEHDVQAEARNYRGGSEQHKKITRIDLITPGSLDEVIIDAVSQKYDISKNILNFKGLLTSL